MEPCVLAVAIDARHHLKSHPPIHNYCLAIDNFVVFGSFDFIVLGNLLEFHLSQFPTVAACRPHRLLALVANADFAYHSPPELFLHRVALALSS